MIVGGISLEAAPTARQDDAETASIIVNGRKGLYERGHRGGPSGERNGQYRHSERTKAAIAEQRKFSALLKMLRAGLT